MKSLGFYARSEKEGEPVKVVFSHADKENGNYVAYDGSIRMVLPFSEYFGAGLDGQKLEELWQSGRVTQVVGKEIDVLVSGVDQLTGEITCKREGVNKVIRERKREEIEQALERGETVDCDARIVAVIGKGAQSRALLRTEGGLKLLLWCKKWSYDYIEDLGEVAKPGDRVKVAIYGKNNTRYDVDYLASRAERLPNPWTGLDEKFHKGDVVVVRIVKKWNGGFSGRIEGVEAFLPMSRCRRRKAGICVLSWSRATSARSETSIRKRTRSACTRSLPQGPRERRDKADGNDDERNCGRNAPGFKVCVYP